MDIAGKFRYPTRDKKIMIEIGNFKLGDRVFIIAEIGNNHNGDFKLALEMIDAASDAGADCVKFQMRNMSSLYRKRSLSKDGEDLGTEYILDLLDRFELSTDEHRKISEYCAKKGILYMCTPGSGQHKDPREL